MCNYTFLPATVKMLEIFLKAILLKTFQLFRHIFCISSTTEAPSLYFWFQSREQFKVSWNQFTRECGIAPLLSHCYLLRNRWPKPTGVLEHCREGNTNCPPPICGDVSFWPHPLGDEGCQCTFCSNSCTWCKLYQLIPVNCASEFRKTLEAAAYICDIDLCNIHFSIFTCFWEKLWSWSEPFGWFQWTSTAC